MTLYVHTSILRLKGIMITLAVIVKLWFSYFSESL